EELRRVAVLRLGAFAVALAVPAPLVAFVFGGALLGGRPLLVPRPPARGRTVLVAAGGPVVAALAVGRLLAVPGRAAPLVAAGRLGPQHRLLEGVLKLGRDQHLRDLDVRLDLQRLLEVFD